MFSGKIEKILNSNIKKTAYSFAVLAMFMANFSVIPAEAFGENGVQLASAEEVDLGDLEYRARQEALRRMYERKRKEMEGQQETPLPTINDISSPNTNSNSNSNSQSQNSPLNSLHSNQKQNKNQNSTVDSSKSQNQSPSKNPYEGKSLEELKKSEHHFEDKRHELMYELGKVDRDYAKANELHKQINDVDDNLYKIRKVMRIREDEEWEQKNDEWKIFVSLVIIAAIARAIYKNRRSIFKKKNKSSSQEKNNTEQEKYMKEAGRQGEERVKRMLKRLSLEHHVYNDKSVALSDDAKMQIDHIVFCQKGIILIETKNYAGTIDMTGKVWKQTKDGVTRTINNAYFQSVQHYNGMKRILSEHGFGNVPIYAIVVMANENSDYVGIEEQRYVLRFDGMNYFIENLKDWKDWFDESEAGMLYELDEFFTSLEDAHTYDNI